MCIRLTRYTGVTYTCRQYVIVRRFCRVRGVTFSGNLLIVLTYCRSKRRQALPRERRGKTVFGLGRPETEINSVSCILVWFSDRFASRTADYRASARSLSVSWDTRPMLKQGRSRNHCSTIYERIDKTISARRFISISRVTTRSRYANSMCHVSIRFRYKSH